MLNRRDFLAAATTGVAASTLPSTDGGAIHRCEFAARLRADLRLSASVADIIAARVCPLVPGLDYIAVASAGRGMLTPVSRRTRAAGLVLARPESPDSLVFPHIYWRIGDIALWGAGQPAPTALLVTVRPGLSDHAPLTLRRRTERSAA